MQIIIHPHLLKSKLRVMKKLLLLITICGLSTVCFAYPITPRPLRKLVIESESIVWAYVAETGTIKQKKKQDYISERDFATLIIREQLQGKLSSDTITVFFSSTMICPAPGVFFKGETVLAFLDKDKKNDSYSVHALYYGVKHGLTVADYDIYKNRIREMQEYIHAGIAKENNEKIINWLVKCAEQKCTRWEGVYELSPHSDFMSYYDQDQQSRKDLFLNSAQKKNLFAVLLATDTLDYSDIPLVDIVRGANDSLLLNFLKARLQMVDKKYPWMAIDIMQRIADLTGNSTLENLADEFKSMYFKSTDDSEEKTKKLLADFIEQMKNADLKKTAIATGNWNA